MIVVLIFASTLCQCVASQTLLDVAKSLNANMFVKYVNDSGLSTVFTKNGKFTLFIPTDDAFNALPSDVKMQLTKEPELLQKVLMFHGVDGIKYSSMLTDGLEVESLDIDAKIRINIYNNSKKVVLASGSEVIRTDINATNGVIHLLSRVMYPLPTSDALQFLAQDNNLGTLLYSIVMTPLRGILEAGGPFTIFAPNNDAFNKLQVGYWSDLFNQNYTAYVDMLKYHVVRGTLYSEGLKSGPLMSYTGQVLHVHVNNSKFTLFIPTDDAFNALPSDVKMQLTKEPELLQKVLMFHGVDGIKYSSMLTDGLEVESLDIDAKIRINIYNNSKKVVLASGSEVIRTDINATNGVIHLLSRVMYPLPTSDALQFLAQDNNLGTLLYSIVMTPLRGILEAGGPFTIFAPNNDAFNKLQVGYWSDLFNQNYTAYVDMLKYHVVRGTIYSEGLKSGPLMSYTGQVLHVHVNNKWLKVNNGTVVLADQTIKNGVIHIIDTVLVPGS